MRLQPVAAQPLRRMAQRAFTLSNGQVVPAGTYLELSQYGVMRGEEWGWEDVNDFRPVRCQFGSVPPVLRRANPLLVLDIQSS
jgi:cytochrome P450